MVVSSESSEEELEDDEDSALRDFDLWLLLLLCVLCDMCDLRDLRDLLDLMEGEGERCEPPSSHSRMERGTSAGGTVMISVRRSMICGGGSGGASGGASIMYWVRPVAWVSDDGHDVILGNWG